MTQFRQAVIAAALLASGGAVQAQTTVITREPVQTQTTIVREPTQTQTIVRERVELTPVQRRTIYRTIVRERVQPAAPTVEYRVGMRVPESAVLYPVPDTVAVEVPMVKRYKFMVVNGHVVLVDPTTSEVVAEVAD